MQPEGPGPTIIIAYAFMILYGLLIGLAIGWFLWA